MNKISKFCLYIAFICASHAYLSASQEDNLIDYHVDNNTYAVIYVESETTSKSDAEKYALQRAAQLAHSNGYRYFVVNKEEQVQVVRGETPDHPFHDNMYQELIIERDFGKSSIAQESAPEGSQVYPGLKITYTCYRELPSKGKVIDVCSLIQCGK